MKRAPMMFWSRILFTQGYVILHRIINGLDEIVMPSHMSKCRLDEMVIPSHYVQIRLLESRAVKQK